MNKLTNIRIIDQNGSPSEKYPVSTVAKQVLLSEGSTKTIVDTFNEIQNSLDSLTNDKINKSDFNDEKIQLQNAINTKLNIDDFNNSSLKTTDLQDAATAATYESVTATNMENRQYPIVKDKNGKLSVNVPWIDTNSDLSGNSKLGQGYGTCSTSASLAEKIVTLSEYSKINGGIVSVYFSNKITGDASLNINNTGASQIRYQNKILENGVILAKDTVTFIYDEGNDYFRIISIDRDNNDNTMYPSMSEEQSNNLVSDTPYVISPKILNTKINKTVDAKKISATGDGLVTFSIN